MKDHGLKVVGSFIWGNKFDTPDSLHRLLDRIFELRLSHFQVGMFCPFPGTDLYKEVSNLIFVKDWSYYDIMHVTQFHPRMDPYTMQSTWIKAQKDIWSLSIMIKRLTEFFSPPINKLFCRLVTPFAEAEFKEYLDVLSTIYYRKAMQALPAEQ